VTDASIVIVTKDRRDELRRALESALEQTCRPDVIVVDDGSTDGTTEMIAAEFPQVLLHRAGCSQGYVRQRNVGVGLAVTPVVVFIDDDAVLVSRRTVEQTVRDFEEPRVGAVAIPYVDVDGSGMYVRGRQQRGAVLVTSEFVGTAAAVRRDVFDRLGGFRESIFHQGEERDFCARLLAAGWVVRVGGADAIHHHPSARRDVRRMDLYGRRNTILYAWYNEPIPSALVRMAEMSVQGIASGVRVGRPLAALRGLALGYRACWDERARRRPLPRNAIRLFRRLWKHGPLPLADVERSLAPLSDAGGR
jgi:GT2 family glycosyltransferase